MERLLPRSLRHRFLGRRKRPRALPRVQGGAGRAALDGGVAEGTIFDSRQQDRSPGRGQRGGAQASAGPVADNGEGQGAA